MDNKVKTATKSLNTLKRNLHDCHTGVKDKWYKYLVRPILQDSHTQRNVNKMKLVQQRAALFVKCDYERTSNVTSMLTYLNLNTVQERKVQNKSTVLYKILHNLFAFPAMTFSVPIRTSSQRWTCTYTPSSQAPSQYEVSCQSVPSQLPAKIPLDSDCRSTPSKHTLKLCFSLYIGCF